MPPDFQPPVGLEFRIDDKDPIIAQYRVLANKFGFDQSQYSEGLALIGKLRIDEAAQIKQAFAAEVAKLGAAGPNRIDAMLRAAPALFGPKHTAVNQMLTMHPTADMVEALEYAAKQFSSQGVTPFNAAHRTDGPPANKIPGYENMSFEQRRHAQEQRRLSAASGR